MNKKIIVLVGISGSGKSTFAHQQWLKDPLNTVIINRDKIRELLFGYTEESIKDYYTKGGLHLLENKVTEYEDMLISESVHQNNTIIMDATHLSKKYLKRYEDWGIPFELVWFDVSLNEAICRDSKRVRKVGKEIITKQFNNYINLKKELAHESKDTD